MSRLAKLAALTSLLLLSLACGSGSSSTGIVDYPDDPFVLNTPNSDQTIARGDYIVFSGTMEAPQDYQYVEFLYDADETFDNGNEAPAAFATPASEINAEWDTVAVDPGTYHIVIVVYKEGARAYGYAPFTVTVTGEELFTLTSPDDDVTLPVGALFNITGTLRSVDRFETIEFYLDNDNTWGNSNEELIIETSAVGNLSCEWTIEGLPVGAYNIAIVLYFSGGGGRLIGYLTPTLTIEPMSLP
ncbi:MAG: hypothetical protein Kow00107_08340 [Planctomycetota bacterium]